MSAADLICTKCQRAWYEHRLARDEELDTDLRICPTDPRFKARANHMTDWKAITTAERDEDG